jgi:hypothetical protein
MFIAKKALLQQEGFYLKLLKIRLLNYPLV